MKYHSLFVTVALFLYALPSFAQKVSLHGTYFGNGNYLVSKDNEGAEDDNKMAFQTTRMYIGMKVKMDKAWSARVTLDVGRFGYLTADGTGFAAGASPNLAYIKYAYFQAKLADELTIRAGTQATPWVGFIDKTSGHRYIFTHSTAYFKWLSSADTGVSLLGKVADGYVHYHVGLFNGTGYKKDFPELGPIGVQVEGRVSFYPLAKSPTKWLRTLGVHLIGESHERNEVRSSLFGGGLTIKHKYAEFLFEGLMKKEEDNDAASGMILAALLKLKYNRMALFGDFVMFKSDQSSDYDLWSRAVLGLTFDFSKKIAVSLDYQHFTNVKHKDSSYSGIFANTKFSW